MNDFSEKRTFERHKQEANLICAFFNTNKYHQGQMRNYGEGGLFFESKFPFKPGTSIYIRIEKFARKSSHLALKYGCRTVTLGEVKWCEEISDTESNKYGIGVRYYEPY